MFAPNELIFTFGFFTSVPILMKIHKKNASVRTRRRTRRQRQTGFIICPVLYAIATRQIKMGQISGRLDNISITGKQRLW